MSKRKEFKTEVLDVKITSMNDKALGIGRYTHDNHEPGENRNLKLTIPNTLPGDTVRVSVPNARGRKRAQLNYDSILEPSPDRVKPPCIHFEYCGGCSLQQLSYINQLKWKTAEVKRFLEEHNHDSSVVEDALGMDEPWHYRNKMEFTFGSDGTLGMHEQGNFRVVRDIHDCLIATKDTVAIRSKVSLWQHHYNIPGYNKDKHEGVLRHLMVRHLKVTDEIMVAIFATTSHEDYSSEIDKLVEHLPMSLRI